MLNLKVVPPETTNIVPINTIKVYIHFTTSTLTASSCFSNLIKNNFGDIFVGSFNESEIVTLFGVNKTHLIRIAKSVHVMLQRII